MTHKFRIWNGKEYATKPIYLKCSDGSIYDYERDYGGTFSSHKSLSKVSGVVEQWTGLTDKNGKEIYEGDILPCDHHVYDGRYKNKPRIEKIIGKIFWHHSYYAVAGYKLFIMDDDSYEVIGNVHENLELLEENDE